MAAAATTAQTTATQRPITRDVYPRPASSSGNHGRRCGRSADGPGVAAIEELLEIAVPLPLLCLLNLLRHDGFVGGALDRAKDTNGCRKIGRSDQAQKECQRAVLLVVHEQVGLGDAVSQGHHLERVPTHTDALVGML